jgi:hypothetical protein
VIKETENRKERIEELEKKERDTEIVKERIEACSASLHYSSALNKSDLLFRDV